MAGKEKKFYWVGITANGKKTSGNITAKNAKQAKMRLNSHNITIIQIEQKKKLSYHFKKQHLYPFTHQLKTLIDAKISILNSLTIIQKTGNKSINLLAESLASHISAGKSFSEALNETGQFDLLYVTLIMAAEKTANLSFALDIISNHLEVIEEFKSILKKGLLYPTIVIIIAMAIFILMMVFVIPEFRSMYSNLNVKLPLLTQSLLNLSIIIKKKIVLFFVVFVLATLMFRLNKKIRFLIKTLGINLLASTPFLKKGYQYHFTAHWTKLLATMTRADIPLLTAIKTSLNMLSMPDEIKEIKKIIMKITSGASLSQAMKQSKSLFPSQAIYLIHVAESAGNLSLMLEKIANMYYELVKKILNDLCKLLEPVIIIFISLIIGIILLAMYLPIFNLNSLI